jgi:WD40 repeat protein
LVFTPGGSLLAVAHDALQLWDVDTGALRLTCPIDPDGLYALVPGPDGRTFAAVYGRAVALWRVEEQAPFYRLELGGEINAIALAADGTTLAIALEDTVELWRVGDDEQLLRRLPAGAQQLAFARDGALAATARGAQIMVWDTSNGALLHSFEAGRAETVALAFSSDTRLLASAAEDGALRLWAIGPEDSRS